MSAQDQIHEINSIYSHADIPEGVGGGDTAKRQIVDTEVLRAHDTRVKRLYDEAVARVVARYTYDAHDCLTLTGTPSGME